MPISKTMNTQQAANLGRFCASLAALTIALAGTIILSGCADDPCKDDGIPLVPCTMPTALEHDHGLDGACDCETADGSESDEGSDEGSGGGSGDASSSSESGDSWDGGEAGTDTVTSTEATTGDTGGDTDTETGDASESEETCDETDTGSETDTETGTDCPDLDLDGVCDEDDNCPETWNPYQLDEDMDGVGWACDFCDQDPGPDHGNCEAGVRKLHQSCWAIDDIIVIMTHGHGHKNYGVCKKRCLSDLWCSHKVGKPTGHCSEFGT